jgi:hypothetical protein
MFDANMYLKILFKYFPVQIYGLILETFKKNLKIESYISRFQHIYINDAGKTWTKIKKKGTFFYDHSF